MAKERLIKLPETKGEFKLSGVVMGLAKDKAFQIGESQKGNQFKTLRFGVSTSMENTIYLDMGGYAKDQVLFYSRSEKTTETVPFANRNSFKKEGYELIGIDVRLEKDKDGKSVKKMLTELDSAEYTKENLKDGDSVFVLGELEFSSFVKNGEKRRSKKYIPKRLYSAKKIDLEAEDFVENCDFKQKIVYTGIEKNEDGTFTLSAKIVRYSTIEDVEFHIENTKLASTIKKKIKPYTAMEVVGKLINKAVVEDVETAVDEWGDSDPFKQVKKVYDNKLMITGVLADTFDTETYTEKEIEETQKLLSNFGNQNNQASVKSDDDDDWGDTGSKKGKEEEFEW